jgi:MFS transporter, FSR family, fosmidomycin resistance protein
MTIPLENEEFQTAGVATVSSAHAVHDTYTSFLPPLLPVLIERYALTNTAAGLLSVFLQIPSLFQPLIGHLADRMNLRLLIILAPAVTGTLMSFLPLAPAYGVMIFLLVAAGLSSASLHAIGPVLASTFAGKKLGRGMSFWMVGGELGRALGPLVAVSAIRYLSAEGFPWVMLGGILMSAFLYGQLKEINTKIKIQSEQVNWKKSLKSIQGLMLPMSLVIFTRAMVMTTLTTFLPTYLTSTGVSLLIAGASLTILQISGMIGAFLSGSLSDRFGRQRILIISFAVTPFLIFLFLQSTGFIKMLLLILLGFFAISVEPVTMAIVLAYCPNNRSFANGIYMALGFSLRSLSILLVGLLSDWIDLRFTFLLSAGLMLLGLIFIFFLPKSKKAAESEHK